jgi:hypothetical protein
LYFSVCWHSFMLYTFYFKVDQGKINGIQHKRMSANRKIQIKDLDIDYK